MLIWWTPSLIAKKGLDTVHSAKWRRVLTYVSENYRDKKTADDKGEYDTKNTVNH